MTRRAIALLCLALSACESGRSPEHRAVPSRGATPPSAAPKPASSGPNVYGKPLSAAPEGELAAVLAEPERYAGQNLVLRGHVRRACTRKGCWMELATGTDPATPACRVFFHGYGFFVPTDSTGSDARVEGRLELVTVSPAHAAHLEEEGGRVPGKAADGSAREVRLLATGVELTRRGG